MSEDSTIPIIIGITGKRDLAGKDNAVRRALKECFALLDKNLPASRKILLSAFATGADTIAAEEALGRESWSVVGILPFDPDTYAQDFSTTEETTFRALLANRRIKWRTLTALTNPTTERPFVADELVRQNSQSNPDRTDHYEQVGLYIAEQSVLLVGVMDAKEQPDRIGGTARILDYRLRGTIDDDTRRVMARSSELRLRLHLDRVETRPAWLVDLAAVDKTADEPLRSVQLWKPAFKSPEKEHGLSALIESLARSLRLRSTIDTDAPPTIEKIHWRRLGDLMDPLRLTKRIDVFNQRVSGGSTAERLLAIPTAEDASLALRRIRRAVSNIQSANKHLLRLTIVGFAILFVVAIFCLELYIEYKISIGCYILAFAAILLIYFLARWTRLQQHAEDYRSVAEALRVQLVWWDAGMIGRRYQVAVYFLLGTAGSLALVRAAIRHIVDAALLERLRPAPSLAAVVDWIEGKNGQINYFTARLRERERNLARANKVAWLLFVSSLGLAVGLLTLVWGRTPIYSSLATSPFWGEAVAVAVLLWLVTTKLSKRVHGSLARGIFSLISFLPPLFCGVLFAALINYVWPGIVGHKLTALLMVVIAACAGATRYVTESLAWEAELHSYREARGMFLRAAARGNFSSAGLLLSNEQQEILFDLGRFALEENGSWIRAHRVRPLEPMH